MVAKRKNKFKSLLLLIMLLILPVLVVGALTAKYLSSSAYLPTSFIPPTPTPITATPTPPLYECTGAPLMMKLLPETQSARAGSLLTYTLKITNNDRLGCPATTYSVRPFEIPTRWTSSLSTTSVKISPQKSATVTVNFRSLTLSKPGNYKVGLLVNYYNYGMGVQANYYIVPPSK